MPRQKKPFLVRPGGPFPHRIAATAEEIAQAYIMRTSPHWARDTRRPGLPLRGLAVGKSTTLKFYTATGDAH